MQNLNVKKFLDAFGGRTAVRNRFRKYNGEELGVKQVAKWVERNSIPGDHLITLQSIGALMEPPIQISKYIQPLARKKGKPNAIFNR